MSWRTLSFRLLVPALAAIYVGVCATDFAASHFAHQDTRAAVQRAVRLQPGNADYWHRLGLIHLREEQNASAAIPDFRRAVELDHYDARAWLDLGLARGITGDIQGQQKAVDEAVRVAPTTPSVAWEAANLDLVWGRTDQALAEFHNAIAYDPRLTDRAVQLCWQATHDTRRIMSRVLPSTAQAHLALLNVLVSADKLSEAGEVWSRIKELGQPVAPKFTFAYIDGLIDAHQGAAASRVWQDTLQLDALEGYTDPGNAVVNGRFLQPVLNGGFDWRVRYAPGVTATLDSSEPHDGIASLSIHWDKTRADSAGVVQFVNLRPNARYHFAAAIKARDLETASGPAFVLTDAYTGKVIMAAPAVEGSFPWRTLGIDFSTGPETNLAILQLTRSDKNTIIDGTLWMNDVQLAELTP